MVFFPDGRQPPVVNVPGAGPSIPLAYSPGGPNPTAPSSRQPLLPGVPFPPGFGIASGAANGAIGGALAGGRFGPIGAAIGAGIGAMLGAGLGSLLEDGDDDSPPGGFQAPFGSRLVVLLNGQIVAGVWGPRGNSWSFSIQNPAIHEPLGAPWDGKPIIDGAGRVKKRAIIQDSQLGRIVGGIYDQQYEFALVDGLGNIIPESGNPPGTYQPGRTLDPQIAPPPSPGAGDPNNPFDDPNFLPDLRDALGDVLGDLMGGGSGGSPGSGGNPPDEDGDGEPDEKENDDDDDSCKGKHPLGILKSTVDSLYKIAGGPLFGGDKCAPGSGKYNVNPEQFLRAIADKVYNFDNDQLTPAGSDVENLPELVAALLAVGYARSGQYKFPTQVAESVVKGDQFLDGIFGQPAITLSDQQDYHAWFFKQFDAVMGQWQQRIEIIDTDLEQAGNQGKTVRLVNVAEATAELFMMVYDIKATNDTLLNFTTRLALESADIKARATMAQKWAELVADYLGPEVKETKADLPLLFTLLSRDGEQPSEANIKARNNLATILEVSQKEIVIPELGQRNTLQSDLQVLKQAAAITRAANAKSLGNRQTFDQIKNQLKGIVNNAAGLIDGGNNEEEEQPAGGDFSSFLNEAEMGFTGTPGITDGVNPYGRPQNQRPRIREIGRDGDDS